jgi:predicted phosphate transport protein (TIGR00153 family)
MSMSGARTSPRKPGSRPGPTARVASRSRLQRWLPITAWLRSYHRPWLRYDTIAALTVVGLLVPESMAYAQIAGVPPQAGLYATLAGLVIYALFGTSRQLACSPTSTAAIMAAAIVAAHGATGPVQAAELVAMVAVLVGLFSLTAGIAHFGFISEFLARPVVAGYVMGLALTIIVRQIPKLLGLQVPTYTDIFRMLWSELTHLSETSLTTAVLSACALAVLFTVRRWPVVPGALTVLVAGLVVSVTLHLGAHGVALVGAIPSGLPAPRLPDVHLSDALGLLPSAAGIAIVVYAEALSGARTFAIRHGYEIDANQELVALGLANIGSGAFGGIVVSGGLSGSALNDTSGAKSQMASLIGAGVMLVAVFSITRVLHNLPEAILGAVVVRAVWRLVDVSALRRIAGVRAIDAAPALAALVGVLALGVLRGLGVAVGLSLVILLYRSSRPHAAVLGRVPDEPTYYTDIARHPENETLPGLLIFRLDGQLYFANAGLAVDRLNELLNVTEPTPRVVIWSLESTVDVDVTSADTLQRLVRILRDSGRDIVFAHAGTPVLDVFRRSGLLDLLGEDHLFLTVDAAVRECLHSRLAVIATLEGQLAETVAACDVACALADGTTAPGDAYAQISAIEQRGDALRGELVARLSGVLVEPIDREDLFRLSRSIDDVLDNLRDFVREWDLFKVEATDEFLSLLDATANGVGDLHRAVKTIARDPLETSQAAMLSKTSANEVRRLYHTELARLFSGELTMEVLKCRELLRRLDVVGLRLNEAADRLSDAAVKRWA